MLRSIKPPEADMSRIPVETTKAWGDRIRRVQSAIAAQCSEHKWIEDYDPKTGTFYRCKYCDARS